MIGPLIVDAYSGDFGGMPDIKALVAAGLPWAGIVLKATEGTYYPAAGKADWFLDHWYRARVHAGARYGKTWVRGAYHYFRADEDPVLQAEKFLGLVHQAGGFSDGDLWPMIDVESAENPTNITAAQLEDGVAAWTAKVLAETGRTSMLYGNVYLAERGVTSYMGCGALTVARYSATLPAVTYERLGWILANPAQMPTLWGWQYSGDPDGGYLAGYPTKCPMSPTENADIIAIVAAGGGQAGLDWTVENLLTTPPTGLPFTGAGAAK